MRRTPSSIGQKSAAETMWMVVRMSVAWTTRRSSSACVSIGLVKSRIRDHRPMYPAGAYCV